jgi:Polyketide cyclase / dehydrase and lipid transport
MASIFTKQAVEVASEKAWASLRLVGQAHKLFAPVLVEGHMNGDTRTVRFANGMVVRERILDVDDERRRVAYTVLDGPGMMYHHASMQVVDAGPGRCLFLWTTDFLPQEIGGDLEALIEQGTRALKANLEAGSTAARREPEGSRG